MRLYSVRTWPLYQWQVDWTCLWQNASSSRYRLEFASVSVQWCALNMRSWMFKRGLHHNTNAVRGGHLLLASPAISEHLYERLL